MKMKTKSGRLCLQYLLTRRVTVWSALVILLGTVVLVANICLVYNIRSGWALHSNRHEERSQQQSPPSPTLWIYHKTDRMLGHVITVFNRLGYTMVGPGGHWDVMWSHEYPFTALPRETWKNLKPQQKVNHFPGSGCYTFKPRLATLNFPFIPKAFRLPQQASLLQAEASAHPEKLWVHKSNMHRGIRVQKIKDIDLHSRGAFVQEFVSNPLLIDGRKFDIGVYTAVTAVNPLRVYTYEEEVLISYIPQTEQYEPEGRMLFCLGNVTNLLDVTPKCQLRHPISEQNKLLYSLTAPSRFCSMDYYPFDANKLNKYVVVDDYTQTWEIPSLNPLVAEKQFSNKQALNIVLREKGYNTDDLWEQITSIITQVLLHCESDVINVTRRLTDSRHFFELLRFDFVLDEELTVWLMEVNLSPNLSSNHTPKNRVMYEQVIFNLLSLVGLARAVEGNMRYNGEYESVMLVSNQDIQVSLEECIDKCRVCSSSPVCQLCKPCQNENYSFLLKTAFLEHVNRRNFKRVYPPPTPTITPHSLLNQPDKNMTLANFLMNVWFQGKCKEDSSWCC